MVIELSVDEKFIYQNSKNWEKIKIEVWHCPCIVESGCVVVLFLICRILEKAKTLTEWEFRKTTNISKQNQIVFLHFDPPK